MMDIQYALNFLKENQPMPNDECLSEQHIAEYDNVRKFFLLNPDERCIPLFLNSFGNGSGLGVYQVIDDVIRKYEKQMVLPHLLKAINSDYNGVRYWSLQIAAEFPDELLLPHLQKCILDSDPDIRSASMTALSQIKNNEAKQMLKSAFENETDSNLLELLEDILKDIKA